MVAGHWCGSSCDFLSFDHWSKNSMTPRRTIHLQLKTNFAFKSVGLEHNFSLYFLSHLSRYQYLYWCLCMGLLRLNSFLIWFCLHYCHMYPSKNSMQSMLPKYLQLEINRKIQSNFHYSIFMISTWTHLDRLVNHLNCQYREFHLYNFLSCFVFLFHMMSSMIPSHSNQSMLPQLQKK